MSLYNQEVRETYTVYPEVVQSQDKEAVQARSDPYPQAWPGRGSQKYAVEDDDIAKPDPLCSRKKPHFLRKHWRFVLAVLVALISGAGIGGGVSNVVTNHSCRARTNTSNSSNNNTNTLPSLALSTGCGYPSTTPDADFNPIYSNPTFPGIKFAKFCNSNPLKGSDVFAVSVRSWDLCMDACAQYNADNKRMLCFGVVFTPSFWGEKQTCFLKPQMPTLGDSSSINNETVEIVASWWSLS